MPPVLQNDELMTVQSPPLADSRFDIDAYLTDERAKDLLRFSTAGSVDDGKSTLIGRLLFDTQSVYDDQLRSIEGKGTTAVGVLDLALLTDGLRAEREQGITIDVAYRYFSTGRRKFIIADTPGHVQYTRNMATGASTADAAIVLIDARKGLLPQSRRHASIAALFGIRNIIVAVNKMDLVGYAEQVFEDIRASFHEFFYSLDTDGLAATSLHFVPVSALAGDNVVHPSTHMGWYEGPTLLDLLETVPSALEVGNEPFRFAVQRVVRHNLDFRGFSGQIAGGSIRPGDRVVALPSGRTSQVERIVTMDGDLAKAWAPMSVTLTLADEIDLSRGDTLATPDEPAKVATAFTASLVWMDAMPLETGKRYLLKHGSRTVAAKVDRLVERVELSDTHAGTAAPLAMNDIGVVEIETLLSIALDAYTQNRHTGSFVLIDAQTNATVAAGMVGGFIARAAKTGAVTQDERLARFGHGTAHLHLHGPATLADALERALFTLGANVVVSSVPVSEALTAAGLLVITSSDDRLDQSQRTIEIDGRSFDLDLESSVETPSAVDALLRLLRDRGVFPA